ncbi:MAG: hypothetical protein MJD61_08815 [Proteobacteria bacterium]|nr:hypothetical protein [Pseudomonadota bacterium]
MSYATPVSRGHVQPAVEAPQTGGASVLLALLLAAAACDRSPLCGDGTRQAHETCDSAIQSGFEGACPASCDDGNPCTTDHLLGDAGTCSARCEHTVTDCAGLCGDGLLQPGELCDPGRSPGLAGACPASCDDGDPCTRDQLAGAPERCSASCEHEAVAECVDNDACCPPRCDVRSDSDCTSLCGDGLLQQGERCDPKIPAPQTGFCPTVCDDGDPCSVDTLVGDPATCTSECKARAVDYCLSGDRCCPPTCDFPVDLDCKNHCGDGVIDPIRGERCDPCPASCDDGNPCTRDRRYGDPSTCDVRCESVQITACESGDGCCAPNCSQNNDTDCSGTCGDGVVQRGETCDPAIAFPQAGHCPASCADGDSCTLDTTSGSSASCNLSCSWMQINRCANGDGCCPPGCTYHQDADCPLPIVPVGRPCRAPGDCPGLACFAERQSGWPGGLCSRVCNQPGDCPPGSECVRVPEMPQSMCLPSCKGGPGSCPSAGMTCLDTKEPVCVPSGGGQGAVSDPCIDSSHCRGYPRSVCLTPGVGFRNGYCSIRCPEATWCNPGDALRHCVSSDYRQASLCAPTCQQRRDCPRTTTDCWDADGDGVKECWAGEGRIGDPCARNADCPGGRCLKGHGWPRGHCTRDCDVGGPNFCPGGAWCYQRPRLPGSQAICVRACQVAEACREGYICDIGRCLPL